MATKKTNDKGLAITGATDIDVSKIKVPEPIKELFNELGVSKQNAGELLAAFGLPLMEAGPILDSYESIKVTSVEQVEDMEEAKRKRLTLKRIRVAVDKTRKELKEDSLKRGKAIDGVARYIRETIEPAEQYLQLQEDFLKLKEEKELADRIANRTAALVELGADPSVYSLGDMSADAFASLLADLKDANEARAAREKADQEAAAKKAAAEAAELDRVRKENERLRAEQQTKDAAAQAERDALAAKLAQAQREKEEADKLEAERVAYEKAEADRKAEAARKAAAAPDKEKLTRFTDALELIRTSKVPAVSSAEAQEVVNYIDIVLARAVQVVNERIKKL